MALDPTSPAFDSPVFLRHLLSLREAQVVALTTGNTFKYATLLGEVNRLLEHANFDPMVEDSYKGENRQRLRDALAALTTAVNTILEQ